MLKLGEKIISDIYLGDKKIAKVFLGDKLVYQAGGPIFLDYITCDRSCWIDTGIVPTLDSEIEFVYSSTNTNSWYFGCRTNTGDVGMGAGWLSGAFIFFGTTSQRENVGRELFASGNKNTLVLNKDSLTVNGQDYSDYANFGTELSSSNLTLFTMNSATIKDTRGFLGNCYGFKVKESGVLIQDLRPCIDPKGTVCMYEMVTKKYFYNQGTGTLSAGNIIQFVDYIETDGNSYINTEFNPNPLTTQLDIELMLLDDTTPAQAVFGCRGTYGVADGKACNIFYNVNSTKSIRIDWSSPITTVAVNKDELISISCLGNKVVINGTEHRGGTQKVDTYLTVPILLGTMHNATQVFSTGSKIRIYNCKINDNGVLARNLRPCVVAGETGFYDMVTGKVFTNAGTGKLEYTE